MPYSDSDVADPLGVAAISGTGPSLGAAPARLGSGAISPPAGGVESRSAPVVVAEYAGVRVIGPLQWAGDGERQAVTGVIHNSSGQARTMVMTLFLLDGLGARLGSIEASIWDLAPGESRPFTHALPPLPAAATDVSARLEPLVP
jgi:hypothetical protein